MSKLEKVVLPSSIKRVGIASFSSCHNMKELVLNEGLQEICKHAFEECSIETLVIPNSVIHIGQGAFRRCGKLKDVKLGSGVGCIEGGIFSGCIELENVEQENNNNTRRSILGL